MDLAALERIWKKRILSVIEYPIFRIHALLDLDKNRYELSQVAMGKIVEETTNTWSGDTAMKTRGSRRYSRSDDW
jgi:hypothetical protein